MDIQKQIKEDTAERAPHLPLGQLFYLLYNNGFPVKPEDYIEMLKITERFGSEDIDQTAKMICPIIATSETEQLRFYNVIEQYKKLANAADKDDGHRGKTMPRRYKIFAAIFVVSLLLLTIYLAFPKKIYPLQQTGKERTVEKGESLSLDATGLLQAPEDTASIRFAWQFEDGSRQQGVKTAHIFKKPGDYFVKRDFASKTLLLSRQSDSLLVHVCDDLPKLTINIPEAPIAVQEPITLTAGVDAEPGTVSWYQWTVYDSVFTTPEPRVQNLLFSKQGDYSIQCKAVVGSINSPCTVTDNKTIRVLDNGIHYTANFSAARPGMYKGKTRLKWWVTMLLLLPAAGGLLYSLFKRKAKPTASRQSIPSTEALNRGPYEIPFEQNDIKLIQQERDLRRTFIQMRYKAEEETLVLSVPGTISSIIRSGGSPQLIFAPLTQQQQYLILIDRANPKSMLTHFFSYLARSIADEGIPVTLFYYDANFICYNDIFPGGLTLQRLAETNNQATLVIFGRAHELVYSAYPVIEEKFLKELNRWQSKAIVTPLPVKDWAVKEKVLQEYIIVLPADTLSLQKLIPALREKIKPHTRLLEITETEQYSVRDTDFRDMQELKEYLDNDETLFQWLCATCIYPRLKWEVMVEMGEAILDKYGQPERLNYSNLLKLCRISWMQQGVFPQLTRLELLKQLSVENELCARERLLQMLNYSTSIYGEKGYFFEEEKKRQQLTNQFILHASNNSQYERYAESMDAFKKLWKKDAILDMPLKKYLDKKGSDNWPTPVNNGRHSVGLSAYFDQHEVILNKSLKIKKRLSAALGLVLIGLWAYLGYGGGAKQLAPLVALNQDAGRQLVPVTIKIIKDFTPCGDSVKRGFEQLDGYLQFDNEKIPLAYNANMATASFEIPYKSMVAGKGSIMLGWDSNKSVITALNFKDRLLPDSLTISCLGSKMYSRKPLNIRYNDTSGYRDIENMLGEALYQYSVSALQADFTDSSRIIYYEPNQKPRADSIVEIVKQTLGMNVKEEFISEERTPPAVPILFLNTAGPSDTAGTGLTDKQSADEYHRMADDYYQNKQYQQAIQAYGRAININPGDALAYYQRGICYEMLGEAYSEKAIAEYTSAIGINAKDPLYWYRRASVKYGLKRYADAIPDYTKVISINSADTKKQTAYSIYFRGKSNYFLKNLSNACQDFKKSADLGITAGKQDYAAYCNTNPSTVKPDCNRIFYSLKEALGVDAAIVCKLDLSKEKMASIPKELYGFKNLTQLNLGNNAPPQDQIDQLQKALPGCKINYTLQKQLAEIDFGYIELDENGYTNAAGQQIMQNVSRLLKAQPQGKIKLTALYANDVEQKKLAGYMNTIVNMFAKIGVNVNTQLEQELSKGRNQPQQQQNAPAGKTSMLIHVTGINVKDNQNKAAK